ncbi:MAG: hypothetical protein AB7T06_17285 [Kofleriaceae bacterium]
MRLLAALFLIGCGSSTVSTPSGSPVPPATPSDDRAAIAAEKARREELGAAHRKLEDEQATALAATCERTGERVKRCTPSCYDGEPADPRANKKVGRSVEIVHVVCTRAAQANAGPFVILDELGGAKLPVRAARRRFPKQSRKGTWQHGVEAEVVTALKPDMSPGDVVRVTGKWKTRTHPLTKERLRCVNVSHYVKSLKRPLDACGSTGSTACEAAGDAATHGINVVRFRLAEASRLGAVGETAGCQQAALEAVAVARGMPRWRQYASLNTDQWKSWPRYRTRFDGILDEDSLFALAIALGSEAQDVYAACGGTDPKTTVTDEQSFHTCW